MILKSRQVCLIPLESIKIGNAGILIALPLFEKR